MKEKMKGKKVWQRVVALLLVVAMTLSLTPSGLQIAADTTDGEITTSTKSDTITNTDWENQMSEKSSPSSENVGRIWTDKSVTTADSVALSYGTLADNNETVAKTSGADFLVELSALSSTSSLTQTTETSQALDIVLVLDVSGSMSNNITSYTYTATYSVSTNQSGPNQTSYYVLASDGNYYRVSYNSNSRSWYYTNSNNNRVTVSPLTSATDTTSGRVQFYTRSTSSTSKLAALKTAVNSFINSVADENDDRAESSLQQHKISVVTFAGSSSTPNVSGATVVADWASYTSSTVSTLTGTNGTINKLSANGATFADDALSTALSQIQKTSVSSDGAQKVVIFFTDGEPNHGSGFWPSVATSAVNTAYTIKNTYNALLYSVAVYSGADSSDTSTNINAYLNAVSSNYPSATASGGQSSAQSNDNWASQNLSLGTGSDAGYYLVAEDEEGLANIFSGILKDITASAASSPTEVEEVSGVKDPSAGGYVTFVDTLGEFMEVKDFNAIVVDDQKFTSKTVSDPVESTDKTYTTTTYTFTGTVSANAVHEESGDLTDLVIEVKSYADPSKGDEVTVKIPATLLPLLYYDIETDEDNVTTMDITYDYPLRVFYSVGLKDGVKDAMASGDYDDIEGLAAYVAANTDSTGTVNFYSNYYDASNTVTENATTNTYGNTTVSFTPATTNNFYYFQKDREVYTDEACTVRATSIEEGQTYYYLHEYYVNTTTTITDELTQVTTEVTTATYTTKVISFVASSDNSQYLDKDTDGNYYIKAGSPRISLGEADEFTGTKSESGNATATADYYIYPTWTGGNNAVTYLGNNGLVSYMATGSLSISKTVSAAANLTPDPDAEFTFQVTLTTSSGTALSGSYAYSVVDSDTGEAVLNNGVAVTGTISNGGTLTLKDGQTAVITGLPATTKYTVAEVTDSLPGGFSSTGVTSSGTTGTIAAATTSASSFTNTYTVKELVVDTSATAGASKTLTGRAWDDDKFVFYLVPVNGTTVLPATSSIAYTGTDAIVTAAEVDYGTTGGGTVTAMRIEVKAADGTTSGTAVGFDLGTYTFTEPGTYTYRLLEYDSGVSGITYSDATYTLEIVVTDNGNGNLSAAYTLTQDTTDSGTDSDTVVATDQTSGVAAFTNSYDPSTQSVQLEAYKSLNGSAAPRGAFSFTFTALDGAPVPTTVTTNTDSNGNEYWTVSSGDAGIIRSGYISVEADDFADTTDNTLVYSYEVKEVKGTATGVTYDESVYKYEYTFTYTEKTETTDASIGYELTIYKQNDSGEWDTVDNTGAEFTEVVFSNSSKVTIGDNTNAGIQVTKELEGRSWIASDSYEFTLTAGTNTAGVETPTPSSNKLTITDETTSYTDAFGEITYSAAGVYYYTITETNGGQTINGVTYDDSEITVIVTVEQQSDGSLTASVAYESVASNALSATFTNTYDAKDVSTTSTTFAVSKTLSGREWLSTDAFYFDIEAEDDAPLPLNTRIAAEADSTSPSFEYTVTYTEAGTYVYYITEESDASVAISGVTYSNLVYKVVVTVTDDYSTGKLVMDVAYYKGTVADDGTYGSFSTTAESTDIAAFTNTYDAEPVSNRYVGGAKYLVGYDMADGEEFIFTLTPTGDTVAAIENGTVVVTPDTGYESTSGSAYASYYTDSVVAVTSVSGMTDDSYKSFTFGTITYKEEGTYTFKVNEVEDTITGKDNITYDTHTTYVQVVVTDDGSGQLAVTSVNYMDSTYENVTNDWTFTNMVAQDSKDVYATDDDGLAVTDSSGNAVSIDGTLVEVEDVLTYSIDWTNDYYDEDGAAAAATVVITDTIPQYTEIVEGSISDGGLYDETTSTITWTISAAAAATGTVSFQVKVVGDNNTDESLSITNQATVQTTVNDVVKTTNKTNKTTNYTPVTVSNAFKVQKVIVDKQGNAIVDSNAETNVWDYVDGTNYWFRFVLEAYEVDADGVEKSDVLPEATATDSSTASMGDTTGTTTADGNPGLAMNVANSNVYDFGSVTYTEPGTYYYDVWERSAITAAGTSGAALTGDPLPGVSYSGIRYRIKVTVVEVTDASGNTTLEASYVIEYVKDDNGETPADVTYTSSSDTNVKNMVITNVYDEDSEDVRFLGAKVYTDTAGGKDVTQGAFEFKYTVITSGAPTPTAATTKTDPTTNQVYWTVKNDGDGDFSSYPITFTLAQGEKETYYYTVEEVLPEDDDQETAGTQKNGVTYDESVYYIQVVADYTGDVLVVNYYYGTWDDTTDSFVALDSTSSALSDLGRIKFTNYYNAEGTLTGATSLKVAKTLIGRAGGSNETFTFQIKDAGNTAGLTANPMPKNNASTDSSGNTIYTIKVNAPTTDGGKTTGDFADITYTKVGTYTYTISEVEGDNEITTWSDAVYTVVVTVTDNGDGTLKAEVTSFTLTSGTGSTVTDNTAAFENIYVEPKQVKEVYTVDANNVLTEVDGELVGVGSELTYEIDWVNTAIGEDGDGASATIVVTDTVPSGTAYVENSAAVVSFKNVNGGDITGITPTVATSVDQAGNTVITWTFADVPAKAYGTVTFKVKVTEDAVTEGVSNTASVAIGENTVDTNSTYNPMPQKEVVVDDNDADGEQVGVGDTLSYIVTWANTATDTNGDPTSATIYIYDEIPAGTVIVPGSVTAPTGARVQYIVNLTTGGFVWNLTEANKSEILAIRWIITADADDYGEVSFKVTVTEDAVEQTGNEITNKAGVKVGDNAYAYTNETSNYVPEKTVTTSDGYRVGDEMTYSVSFKNTESAESPVVITDVLENTISYVAGTASGDTTVNSSNTTVTVTNADGSTENCAVTFTNNGSGTLGWTVADVPAGATGSVSFTVKINESAEGETINNNATVTVGGHESKTNTVPVKVVLSDSVILSGTKVLSGRTIASTDTFTFQVEAADDTTNTAVTNKLVVISDDEAAADIANAVNSTDGKSGSTTFTFGAITFSAVGTYTFKVSEVEPADGSKLDNVSYDKSYYTVTVTVTDTTGKGDLEAEVTSIVNSGTGTADAITFTNAVPNKDVYAAGDYDTDAAEAESIDGQMVGLGETLTYTIDWANTTGEDDTIITIKDTIPTGTGYVTGSASQGTSSDAVVEASYANGVITWTITAAAGASGTVSFDVEVTEDAFTISDATISNSATLEIGDNTYTTNETTNTVPVKTSNYDSGSQTLKPGEEFSYTISFTNTTEPAAAGEDPVTLVVTDTLVDGLTYNDNYTVTVTLNGTEQTTKYETFVQDAQDAQKLTWTFSNLPAGAQVSITFDVVVDTDAPSSVVNQAYVGGHATNYSITPVPADDDKHVLENGSLVDDELVSVGDVLTYEISWTNETRNQQGNKYADQVTIVDNIPDGIKVDESSISSGGVYDAATNTITWEISITDTTEITRGVVWFSATVTGGVTEIENEAIITAENDYTVTATVYTAAKSVSLVSDDPQAAQTSGYQDVTEAEVGQKVAFTISFTATADVLDNGSVTVKDTLLTGLEYVTASAVVTVDGDAYDDGDVTTTDDSAPAVDGQNLTWTLKNVTEGSEVEITFQADVTRDATSAVENQATVAGHKSNVVTVTVPSDPAKHSKDSNGAIVDGEMVRIGDTLAYEIDWTNEVYDEFGEATGEYADKVTITDWIPEGLAVDTSTIYTNANTTYSYGYDDAAGMYKIIWTIALGESAKTDMVRGTVSFDAKVTGLTDGDGAITNTAYITSGDGTIAVDVTNYVPVKNVALPEGNDDTVAIGQELTYTITFHNADGADATATVKDTLSEGLSFVAGSDAVTVQVNGSAVTYDSANVTLSEAGQELTWTLTKLPENADVTITFKATVTMDALSEVTNTVTVNNDYTSNTTSTTVEEKREKDVVNADGESINGQDVAVGDVLTYEIYWTNTSDEEATVTVTDTVPAGTVYTDASDSYTSSVTVGSYSYNAGLLTWTFNNVPAGTHGKITFNVTVDASAKGTTVENTAYILVGEDAPETDAKPTNTTENDVPDDPEAPVKSVSTIDTYHVEDGELVEVAVGQEITYEIDYYNPYTEATTITIEDELDDGVDYVLASAYDDVDYTFDLTKDEDGNVTKVTWTINAAKFERGTVTLTVKVNESAKAIEDGEETATVVNTAEMLINNVSVDPSEPVEIPVTPDDPEEPTKTISASSASGYYDADGKASVTEAADGTVTGSSVGVGGIIEYVIGYYNHTNSTATIIIEDELDAGVSFESATGTLVEDASALDTSIATVGYNYVTYCVETTTDAEGDEVTTVIWTIYNAKPFTDGDVKLQVEVEEAAKNLETGETTATVENDAVVINGNDPEDPENEYRTNVVVNPVDPDEPGDPVKIVTADSAAGVDGAAVDVGEEITYAVSYYNHNNTTAEVTITDALDPGVKFVSASGTEKSKATASDKVVYEVATSDEGVVTVTWTITDLAAFTGGYVTLTVEVTEDALRLDPGDTSGDVENQATVTVGDITNTSNVVVNPLAPDEPEAPVKSVSEGSAAGSELVEITEDGEFVYGSVGIYDRITYEIDYYNHHNATATVEVVDKLDSGVDFISATGVEKSKATDADLVVYEYDESTHTVTWTIIEEAFTGGSVQVVVEVNEDAKLVASTETVATVENQATVVFTADTSHEATTNVVINTVDPDQPASPSKTVVSDTGANGEVSIGDTVTYEITYYNNLNETADITITDNLDDGVDFVSVGDGENGTYDEDTNTVTWVIKDVAPFTGGAVTLNVEVNEDARALEDGETQASITNTAYVTVGNDADTDPQPTNTTENPLADDDPEAPVKSIVTEGISEDDVLEVGDELTYEITWYNNQNATVDVVITDELDDGVDFVSIDDEIGVYDEEAHTITWTIADAAPFEGGSVTLTVKVNESAQTPDDGEEEPQISNTASVTIGDADAVDTNTVVSLVEPEEEPAPAKKTTAPKTGDVAGVLLFVLFAASGFVVVTTSRRRKKRVRA